MKIVNRIALTSMVIIVMLCAMSPGTSTLASNLPTALSPRNGTEAIKRQRKNSTAMSRQDPTCVDDPEGWHDSEGAPYNCAWYAGVESNCREYGGQPLYENFGKTANEACCACGGGTQKQASQNPSVQPSLLLTHTHSALPTGGPTKPVQVCVDDPEGWYDSGGAQYNCEWYASKESNCQDYGDDPVYDNFGKNAKDVCCVCGGGTQVENSSTSTSKSPSIQPSSDAPSLSPTDKPSSSSPSVSPSDEPTTSTPSFSPSSKPSSEPSPSPSDSPSSTPTEKESSLICVNDPDDWYDSGGTQYDCEWYASKESNCQEYGDDPVYDNFGKNAKDACCVCGGGRLVPARVVEAVDGDELKLHISQRPNPSIEPSLSPSVVKSGGGIGIGNPSSSSPPSDQSPYSEPGTVLSDHPTQKPRVQICVDDPDGWVDTYGDGCDWYGSDDYHCRDYGHGFENSGMTANDACCSCGGGMLVDKPTTTTSPDASAVSSVVSAMTSHSPICKDDPEDWYDSDGIGFDCHLYGSHDHFCNDYGDEYENFGKTANEACCACGGGRTLTCADSPEKWFDSDGIDFDCDWYAAVENENENRCETDGDKFRNFGKTANEACCVCGGGVMVDQEDQSKSTRSAPQLSSSSSTPRGFSKNVPLPSPMRGTTLPTSSMSSSSLSTSPSFSTSLSVKPSSSTLPSDKPSTSASTSPSDEPSFSPSTRTDQPVFKFKLPPSPLPSPFPSTLPTKTARDRDRGITGVTGAQDEATWVDNHNVNRKHDTYNTNANTNIVSNTVVRTNKSPKRKRSKNERS